MKLSFCGREPLDARFMGRSRSTAGETISFSVRSGGPLVDVDRPLGTIKKEHGFRDHRLPVDALVLAIKAQESGVSQSSQELGVGGRESST